MQSPNAEDEYGIAYQRQQVEKYRARATNHWRERIALAHRLVDDHVLPRRVGEDTSSLVVADVGCSIGTFAIEFAKRGFRSFGVDFDAAAIEVARALAKEEGVAPEFFCGDVADWSARYPPIDIAICFDIFEHLHDDQLGSLLTAVRRALHPKGALVFQTYPTEHDWLFAGHRIVRAPLLPFARLPTSVFSRVVRAYSSLLDVGLVLTTGKTHRERHANAVHCNPTTPERLRALFARTGFEVLVIESGTLYADHERTTHTFARHPIASRNIWGVACPTGGAEGLDHTPTGAP